jgi:cold shock CspA family protein
MYDDKLIKEGMEGYVVKYLSDKEKGYGFISPYDNSVKGNIFVYFNQILPESKLVDGFLKLREFQKVKFDLYYTTRGPVAKNVLGGDIDEEVLRKAVNRGNSYTQRKSYSNSDQRATVSHY